jgi:DNA polymerase III subunit alpha
VSQYCETHKHSYYSLLDGVGSAEAGAQRAAELGHPALAMTEHAVVSGVVHHMDACREVGITPIVGVEAYYRPRRVANTEVEAMRKRGEDVEEFFPYFHMVLLAKDIRGWRSLKLLTSESYRSGFYRKPCIDDELLDKWSEGLIASTSCVAGFVPQAILRGDDAAVKQHCAKLDRWFGEDWYWELQPHGFEDLVVVNRAIPGLAAESGRALVAARDAHAPDPTWIETQHVSVKMRTRGSMVEGEDHAKAPDDGKYDLTVADTAYIASAEQTAADFAQHHPYLGARVVEQAIANTGWVASRVTPWLLDPSPKLPRYRDTYEEEYEELRRRVYAGLAVKGYDADPGWIEDVEKELAIYRERRICAFFLLTDDMIRWLRSSDGLPACEWDPNPAPTKTPQKVGLGRGSAGGCRVAYALGIVLINPRAYDLWFERFLNPHRKGLPDIDIDLTEQGAQLAKEWLKRTRGRDRVYDLITHSTFGAKGALRRVAMVYNVPFEEINGVAKKIPDDESEMSLDFIANHVEEIQRYAERHPKAFEHAAGVVISGRPLDEVVPVMKKSAKDDYMVTAFSDSPYELNDQKRDGVISQLGLLKLDLLVIVELAKHAYMEDLVRRVHGVDLDLDKLPALDDPFAVDEKTLEVFRRGAIRGIFQWDGKSNMASLTKRIQPDHLYHLAAANAVVRPGVSAHAESYVARRHGEHFEYWDDAIEPALRETYGLPIYQEQIMAVFNMLGGYSPAEADDVRRIMGKYYRMKGDIARRMLGQYEQRFVESAASICHGGQAMAQIIWDFCGGACEYLFNKSHADEYSLIAVQSAHVKAHFPDAFYAAMLSFPPAWAKKAEERNGFYERAVREARAFGIDVLPPDVNESDDGFTITGDSVRFGMKGIKGLGPAMVADVLANRPFTSLEDMGARLTTCNKAGRHALGAAGALDRFDARANLTPEERAVHEEERIGVALSGEDKLAPIREQLRELIHTQDEFESADNGAPLVVGGEIVNGHETKTKVGPGLKLTVAFGADEYLVSVPPWDYDASKPQGKALRELIASDAPVIVRGAKDTAWSCVAADQIRAAVEVIEMRREQVPA